MTQQLVRLLSDLVALESVNPAYPGGRRGEAAVADYVEDYCRRLGLVVTRQPVLPGRDNIRAELCVPGAQQTLLFEAHMDTVDLGPMGARALQPEVREGKLYGRGSCDTKGSLAAMLLAMQSLQTEQERLRVNVMLLASVDEEHRFRGVTAFVDSTAPIHAAVVGEPTELRIVVAHKGCVRWRLSTTGRAAHSSRPEEGDNAIDQMAAVLLCLRAFQVRLRGRRHPLVGSPTLSVGRIWGGTGVNIVPERCTIEIDRRLIPGEDAQGALAEMDALLAECAVDNPLLNITREEPFVADWPLETPSDAAVVSAACAACASLNLPIQPIGVPYGTDASKLWALGGIPAIVLGPGSIAQAHTADEYVALADVAIAAELYRRIALHLAGSPASVPWLA
ncbi:MAG TPA: M20 family metallopeptidase [Chloroflexota bacterium]|jgi:acetylornithine deacetylase